MKVELSQHNYSGRLIVVCGTDGSGKSTVIQGIASHLNERLDKDRVGLYSLYQPSNWWREDQRVRGTIVKEEDGILADELALGLFAVADRLNQQAIYIEPALREGAVVLVNRYVFDMLTYYMAKSHPAVDYLRKAVKPLFRPDLAILLDCPPEILVDRVKKRDGINDRRYDQSIRMTERIMESYRNLCDDNCIFPISSYQPVSCMIDEVISTVCDCLTESNSSRS
jgi:dTMP kinase